LNGFRRRCRRYPKFVALVRPKGISFHQLRRDLVRQLGIEAALHVDAG